MNWQSGDKFVVKARLADIKGVRMIFEHIIEKLPNHEVCRTKKYTFRTEKKSRNSMGLNSSAIMYVAELFVGLYQPIQLHVNLCI